MKISNGFLIREVQKVDNKAIETTLSKIMREFDVPETGTALADPELKTIFETYNTNNSIYFILEKNNLIFGGAGISTPKSSSSFKRLDMAWEAFSHSSSAAFSSL